MSDRLLSVEGVSKAFAGRTVLSDVSLHVNAGEVVGLLGPNGAGKSTVMRLIYGALSPASGRILLNGQDLAKDREPLKRLLGVCTQDNTLDGDFSVEQNLRIYAGYFRPTIVDLDKRVSELLERFGLREFRTARPDTLSGGYQRRLLIARAVMHSPRILLLDEPSTGLDPDARRGVWELVAGLRKDGLAIVLTTHYMDEAARLADRLVVLQNGKVLASGVARELLGNLLGEHVAVIDAHESWSGAAMAWYLARHQRAAARVLDEIHMTLRADDLTAFAATFPPPEHRWQLRPPDLDDLFLHLASNTGVG